MEARRRDEHLLQRGQRLQPAGVDAGFLVGLAQRGVDRTRRRRGRPRRRGTRPGRRGDAASTPERSPAGRHRRAARRVGESARTREQHQHRGVAACAGQRGLSRWPRSPSPAVRRAPVAGRRCFTASALSTSGLQPGRSGVGSQQDSARSSELTPALLICWTRPRRRSRRRWRTNAAGFRQRYRPTRSTTVAGITLGTCSAAAISRLPSCSVGSRTPSSASRSSAAVSFSSWCTVTTVTAGPTRR